MSAARELLAEFYVSCSKAFEEVKGVDARELHDLTDKIPDLVLVDVRTKAEQDVSIIPGAIAKDDFESSKDKYKNSTIVTYCTIGYRSGKYAAQLQKEGFTVFNFAGSILAWTQEGYPLVTREGGSGGYVDTKRVHVWDKSRIPALGEGYEPVVFESWLQGMTEYVQGWLPWGK